MFLEIPITKLKWWEKIIFHFLPTHTSISNEGTLKYKKFKGVIYITELKLIPENKNSGFDDVVPFKDYDLLQGRERREVN